MEAWELTCSSSLHDIGVKKGGGGGRDVETKKKRGEKCERDVYGGMTLLMKNGNVAAGSSLLCVKTAYISSTPCSLSHGPFHSKHQKLHLFLLLSCRNTKPPPHLKYFYNPSSLHYHQNPKYLRGKMQNNSENSFAQRAL